MTGTQALDTRTALAERVETIALSCGAEHPLLARFGPLVRSRNVTLDLGAVERIDAAGVAALVALYRNARNAGYSFRVARASRRVHEILALVGLDGILTGREALAAPRTCREENAARSAA